MAKYVYFADVDDICEQGMAAFQTDIEKI